MAKKQQVGFPSSFYGSTLNLFTWKRHYSTGYCFNGMCPTLNAQCEKIWGYNSQSAERKCFEQFNTKGSMNGHCGLDQSGRYIKCEPE
jgi:hypothetical protein